jgi:hypothetical protein
VSRSRWGMSATKLDRPRDTAVDVLEVEQLVRCEPLDREFARLVGPADAVAVVAVAPVGAEPKRIARPARVGGEEVGVVPVSGRLLIVAHCDRRQATRSGGHLVVSILSSLNARPDGQALAHVSNRLIRLWSPLSLRCNFRGVLRFLRSRDARHVPIISFGGRETYMSRWPAGRVDATRAWAGTEAGVARGGSVPSARSCRGPGMGWAR